MLFNALVLAQSDTAQTATTQSNVLYLLVVIICGFVLPILAGRFLAQRLRASDYGWKISLVLVLLVLAGMTVGRSWDPETGGFDIPLGVDLKGGVILIYEVDEEASLASNASDETDGAPIGQSRIEMDDLIAALSRRINPSGTKEIVLRKYGDRQIEIIIPEVDTLEVEVIKQKIRTAGMLKFRIVANQRDHDEIIQLAREMAADPTRRRTSTIRDAGNQPVGLWARVAREQAIDNIDQPLKLSVSSNDLVRDSSTGELIDIPVFGERDPDREIAALEKFLEGRGTTQIDVLMATNDGYDVEGRHLHVVTQAKDDRLNPCINFSLKGEGIDKFADLTGDNKPTGNFHRQLGIVLDNELLSAPNIQTMITRNGQITGKFTQEEVEFLVNILNAGSLPVVMNPDPISESVISPLLGQQTIDQGKWAIGISLSTVLVFILIYYRFSGLVASMALLANLLFILAVMITINAAFTLPGLAGLVLTVGMSVDANVLIFERIREEIKKGSAFRMAIRNGFGRATTTIVDANITTLITAIVLYAIGTDQIRGFAVTLILGILISMFTAIFCSRIVFDLAEKSRRLSLNMSQLVGATQFDFIGKRQLAAIFSFVLIVAGITGLSLRGADIFDIDFRGGTSVHLTLNEAMKTDDVRKLLGPKFKEAGIRYTISAMNAGGSETNSVFKVDSSIEKVTDLQAVIQDALNQAGDVSPLATYSLEYDGMRTVAVAAPIRTDATQDGESSGEAAEAAVSQTPAEDDKQSADDTPDTGTPDTGTPDTGTPDTGTPDTGPTATEPSKEADPAKPNEATVTPASEPASPAADPAPAADTPTKDAPATDAPATDAPAADAPAADAPAAPEPGETPAADETPAPAPPSATSETPAPGAGARLSPSTDNLVALASDVSTLIAQADGESPTAPTDPAAEESTDEPAATEPDAPVPATTTEAEAESAAPSDDPSAPAADEAAATDPKPASSMVEVDLTFAYEINYETLRAMIQEALDKQNRSVFFELQNPDWQGGSNSFSTWTLQISDTEAQATLLLNELKTQFAEKPVWRSSSKFGSQVAGRMKGKAVMALLISLLGIILYIWIRFQRVVFGLAAVVALLHDVLVTLGAIALSYWLAGVFGFLLIEEFKISLPIVAALLTIIGYSLNDTIVVFDRIREVRGKSPDLTGEMINTSINQTLGRTILTSFTTLIVVLILYAIGGDGIHGFAFALVVGVTVGTYSSIFVASPALLWMAGTKSRRRSRAA